MKLSICLLFCFSCIAANCQNLLPMAWKISFSDTTVHASDTAPVSQSATVNLLQSWERQGFYSRHGTCRLYTDFEVPANWADSIFSLQLTLQCNIKAVYINGVQVAGDMPGQFRTNRHAIYKIELTSRELLPGKKNRITIIANKLSYTGGYSYNSCALMLRSQEQQEKVALVFDKSDHVYTDTPPAVSMHSTASANGTAEVFIINDFHDTLYHGQLSIKKGSNVYKLRNSVQMDKPGFYECVVVQKGMGYTGDVQWFTVKPEAVKAAGEKPAGFQEYWQQSLKELNNIAPDFKMVKNDSLSRGERDAYIISFVSVNNIVIRGYYFVPRKPGKHAAVLHVPGYGSGFKNLGSFINSKEQVAELALCVRGHGISADVFNPGFDVPGIWGYKLYDKKEIAYRSIYLDCVRAVQFLHSRPEIDPTRVGVMGGSQGGGLTLATAGLAPDKIKACAYFDPFPCDIRNQIRIRKLCVHELQSYLNYYGNPCSFEEALAVQDFIDTKNFADAIKAKTLYTTGLIDDDCPSRVGFGAYNSIPAAKQYRVYAKDSHLAESKIYDDMFLFLKRELGF